MFYCYKIKTLRKQYQHIFCFKRNLENNYIKHNKFNFFLKLTLTHLGMKHHENY